MALSEALDRAQDLMAHAQPRPLPTDFNVFRENDDKLFTQFSLGDATVEPVDAGGVPALWVSAPGSATDRAVIYYHGGGYVIGSAKGRSVVAAAISRAAGCRVLAVDYRLAPEHYFPAATDDAVRVYRWLSDQIGGGAIVVSGDSSGGGVAVATLQIARAEGLPGAAGAALFSPLTDLAGTGASWDYNEANDPVVIRSIVDKVCRIYLNGHDPRDPRVSPVRGDLAGLPPVLLLVGSREVLLDDIRTFAEQARAAGTEAEVRVFDDMFHNWQMFGEILPEGREATDAVGEFVRKHTKAAVAS